MKSLFKKTSSLEIKVGKASQSEEKRIYLLIISSSVYLFAYLFTDNC